MGKEKTKNETTTLTQSETKVVGTRIWKTEVALGVKLEEIQRGRTPVKVMGFAGVKEKHGPQKTREADKVGKDGGRPLTIVHRNLTKTCRFWGGGDETSERQSKRPVLMEKRKNRTLGAGGNCETSPCGVNFKMGLPQSCWKQNRRCT